MARTSSQPGRRQAESQPPPLEFVVTCEPFGLDIQPEILVADDDAEEDVCRFCHMSNPLGMHSLPWPKWPGAEVSHLFRAVTGEVLPNGAGFSESWCSECLDELRKAASLIEKFRQSGEYWRQFVISQRETLSANGERAPILAKSPAMFGRPTVANVLNEVRDEKHFNELIIHSDNSDSDDNNDVVRDEKHLNELIIHSDNSDRDDNNDVVRDEKHLDELIIHRDNSESDDINDVVRDEKHFDELIIHSDNNVSDDNNDADFFGEDPSDNEPHSKTMETELASKSVSTRSSNRPFVCDYCRYATGWKSNIERHMLTVHSQLTTTTNEDDDGRTLRYNTTGRKSNMKRHKHTVHSQLTTITNEDDNGRTLRYKTTGRKSNMKRRHKRTVHSQLTTTTNEDEDGRTLRYKITSGHHIGTNLLYTLDEKHFYRKTNSRPTFYRYRCIEKICCIALIVSKSDGTCRRTGKQLVHNHENKEQHYKRNKFVTAIKIDMMKLCDGDSLVEPRDLINKHLAMDSEGGSLTDQVLLNKVLRTIRRYRTRRTLFSKNLKDVH